MENAADPGGLEANDSRATDPGDLALGAWRWLLRLAPAAALLSLAFVLDGSLRWVAALGLLPLAAAFAPGCPRCAGVSARQDGFRVPPGH